MTTLRNRMTTEHDGPASLEQPSLGEDALGL